MQPGGGSVDDFVPVREVWPAGTVIKGDYVVERKLGQGGFGTVYIARHRYFGTTHVIKRLHEQHASDTAYVRRFFNEGRQIRRLKGCPNIVEVEHMTQSEDGFLILVMEHIAGGDLAGLMERRTLSVAEVIEYGRQIAEGLHSAHAAGLVHRDIKPQNVMVSQDSTGKPVMKLIDFGIAADRQNSDQSTSVMRPGSVGFAAPEQWALAGKELDGRTDLYAMGATLYKMLCGRMPYHQAGGDIGAWIEAIKLGPPPDVRLFRSDCPELLANLISEMLSLKPESRPANAASVAARLQAMVEPPPAEAVPNRSFDSWQATAILPPSGQTPPSRTIPLAPEPSSSRQATETIPVEIEAPRLMLPDENGSSPWKLYGGIGASVTVVVALTTWLSMDSGGGGTRPPQTSAPASTATSPPSTSRPTPPQGAASPIPAKKNPASLPPQPTAAKKDTISKGESIVLGDAAMNSGDLQAAVRYYRISGEAAKLAAAQRAVEGDTEERVIGLLEQGKPTEAATLADRWRKEFPLSQRLQKLRERIARSRPAR